jgi:hypothetical protein
MDNALAQIILTAAGTGAPTNPNSRYYGTSIEQYVQPDGTLVNYLARRILPQQDIYTSVQSYILVEGDRLDNLASRFLGDPLLFWMICDANGATDPDELTSQVGHTILIPLAAGIPAGARNG